MMIAEGGTKDLTYKQIADAMFPDGGLVQRAGR